MTTLSATELLDYLSQVTDRLLQALDGMPTEILHAPAPGLGGNAAVTPGSAQCSKAEGTTAVQLVHQYLGEASLAGR